jgi:hypothetical protein
VIHRFRFCRDPISKSFRAVLEIDRLNGCLIPNSPFKSVAPPRSQIKWKFPKLSPITYFTMADVLKAEGNKAIAEKNFDEAM